MRNTSSGGDGVFRTWSVNNMIITKEDTLEVMLTSASMADGSTDNTRIALLLTGILTGLIYLVQEN